MHTHNNSMSKITHADIQKLDEEEQEVFEAMKDLVELGRPFIALLKREMKRRGRSERRTDAIIDTLHLLGLISLGAGDEDGNFGILGK